MFGRRAEADRLYYSYVFGRGIYHWNGEMVQDPMPRSNHGDVCSPLLTNANTGEQFFIKRFENTPANCKRYRQMILRPIPYALGLWPVDMIDLEGNQKDTFNLYVEQEYRDVPTDIRRWEGNGALLFPYGGYPNLTLCDRFLMKNHDHCWMDSNTRKLATNILFAIRWINLLGYAFFDMHFSRMFVKDDGTIYLDFSNLTYPMNYIESLRPKDACSPVRDRFPLEFAEPAYVQGKCTSFDMRTQNYSLAAMLFYLLLRRYAYDGKLVEYVPDDSIINHYNKMDKFFEAPVFIFDEDDHNNMLDKADRKNQDTIELWESLPEVLKEMFSNALGQSNAERTAYDKSPTPEEWLHQFEMLGWTRS